MTTPAKQPRTLADLRKATGLTSEQVGERMGVNGQRVRHIEAKYPAVRYDTLTRYITALGGGVQFIVGTAHVSADQLIPDPTMRGTRKYLEEKAGVQRLKDARSVAEELVLQGQQAEPGGDHTGRDVDHADAQRDQSDRRQSQERGTG